MLAAVVLLAGIFAGAAQAATAYTWNNAAGGNWNVNANWTPNTGFPVAGDTANINAINNNATISLNGNQACDTLNINTANTFTLNAANGISLTCNFINVNAGHIICGNNLIFSGLPQLTVAAGATFDMDVVDVTVGSISGAGTCLFSNGSPGTFTFGGNNLSTTFSGPITGGNPNKSLVKTGTGTTTLSGNNNYKGPSTVQAGILNLANSSGLGSAATGTTVISGATLQMTATGISDAEPFTINGTGVGGIGAIDNRSGNNALTGAITLGSNSTITSDAGTLTLSNATAINSAFALTFDGAGATTVTTPIGGNITGVTKNGTGTLTLSGNNSYASATTINAGIVVATSATALGTAAAGTTVNNNGTLEISGSLAITEPFTLNGAGAAGANGALESLAASSPTLSGTVVLGSVSTIAVDGAANTMTLSGVVSGAGGLTKVGPGTLTLSNTNTYTGATTVNAGTLKAGSTQAFGVNSAVTMANIASAKLDITGFNNSIGSLAGGGAAGGNVTLGAATLTTGGDNTSTTYGGVISGLGGFTKTGTGTQTLTGAETYTGATTVNNGTLLVDGTLALGSAVAVNAGATLGGTGTVNGAIISTGGTISPGDPETSPGVLHTTAVTLNAASTFKVQLDGTTAGPDPGYDQLNSTGLVTLGGSTLSATIGPTGFLPSVGSTFTIISGLSVSGTFAGLPNNTNVTISGRTFVINYTLNSVVLTKISQQFTWTGGATPDPNWSNANNWLPALVPSTGDQLLFGQTVPTIALQKTTTFNDFAAGSFAAIQFIDSGYTLSGNDVTLTGGVPTTTALNNNFAGSNTISNNIAFATNNPTITCLAGGTLICSGVISGSLPTTIAISGAGNMSVIFTGTNTYSGTTTISGGTLQIGNAAASGTLGTGAVTDNATLAFNRTDAITVSNVISGTGIVTQAGTGTTALTGLNTYTGVTNINAGTLNAGSVETAGTRGPFGKQAANAANTIVFGGGTLQYSAVNQIDYSGRFSTAANQPSSIDTNSQNVTFATALISAGGTLTKLGSGTLTLTAANTYSGTTTISSGTLQVGNAGGTGTLGSGAVTDNAALVFNRNNAVTEAAVISGTGTLTQNGSGTLTLSGANTYSGTTTIAAGTLNANASAAIGDGSATNTLIFTGGTLQAANTITSPNTRTVTLTSTGVIDTNAQSVSIAGIMSGAGGVTKNGTGTLTLSGANTYTGATTVNAGTLKAGVATQAFGNNSAVTLANVASAILDITGFNNTIGSLSGGGATGGNVILGAATLTAGGDNTTTAYVGVISGTGGITKTGTGTLTLSGSNTYSGATNVSGGTLKAGVVTQAFGNNSAVTLANTAGVTLDLAGFNNSIGSLTGGGATGGNVTLGAGTLTVGGDSTSPAAYAGVISGTGGLTKVGTGTLTLSNIANTYTGQTAINNGTVSVAKMAAGGTNSSLGATPVATPILLGSATAGTLSYTGGTDSSDRKFTINGAGGGTIQSVNAGTLTLSGTISNGANPLTLDENIGDIVVSGVIGAGSGGVNKTGTGTLTLSAANTYSGTTTLSAGTLNINNATALGTGPFMISGVSTIDNTSGGAITLTNNNIQNWNADFTFTGSNNLNLGTGAVTLGGNRQVTASANTITEGGVISGGFSLTKAGAGTMVLTGGNLYTGTTTISGGTLQVGNGGATGTLGTGAVTDNAALVFNRNNLIVQSTVISGTGTVTQNGTGALTLSGANTYSGGTTLNSGTLNINNATALGTGTFAIAGVSTIDNTSGGAITLTNNNAQSWNANFTFTGSNALNLGTGAVALSANRQVTTTATILTEGGTISGAFSLTKVGAGTLTLGGASTFSGGMTLSAGQLNINNATALGTGTFTISGASTIDNTTAGAITLTSNNAQSWNADFTFTGTRSLNLGTGAVTINANRQVTTSASTLTEGGSISGAFSLTKAGAGALTLGGASTFTGGATLSAGTLNINNGAALGTGNFTISGISAIDNTSGGAITLTNNNAQSWNADFTFTGTNNLDLGTGAVALNANRQVTANANILTEGGTISGAFNLTKAGAGTTVLTGTNTYSATTISAGTLQIGNAAASGTLGTGAVTDNAALVFKRTDAITVANVISGTGTLTQSGSGTLTLTAVNTFNGATTAGAGTLLVNGTDANSAVSVNGGNFGGGVAATAGTVGTITTAGTGGTIDPGTDTSTGILKSASADFSGGATHVFRIQLNGSTTVGVDYDQLQVTGNLNLSNCTLSSSLGAAYFPANGTTFTIITFTGTLTGNFAGLVNGATFGISGQTFQISYNANTVVLTRVAATFTWNGNGPNANWTTGLNWVGGIAPGIGDSLVFAPGAAQFTANDDFANGTIFNSIQFTGGGYTLTGNSVTLVAGATALSNSFAGASTVNNNLIFSTNAPTITDIVSGTLTITGTINNGGLLLTVSSAGTTNLSGVLSGAGGLTSSGIGLLTLSATETYTGSTNINAGVLQMDGSLTGGGTTTVANGAELIGTGSVQTTNVAAGGTVEPGDFGANATGILTATNNFTFTNSASIFDVLLNGNGTNNGGVAGTNFDQLKLNGAGTALSLNNATLNLFLGTSFPATANNNYTIVNNVSNLAIVGTFNGLPEGALVLNTTGMQGFTISYVGGAGHDVVLHQVPILLSTMYNDNGGMALGSLGGVQSGDTVTLTFSVPVTVAPGGAPISDIGVPVTGDSWSIATIAPQGPSTNITVTLAGAPLLTPGGTYSSGAGGQAPGQPSGVFMAASTNISDGVNPVHSYPLAAGLPTVAAIAAAVDLGPGNAVVAVQWADTFTIGSKVWNIGNADPSDVFKYSDTVGGGFIVRNSGTAYSHFDILCDTVSTPAAPTGSPWTLASPAASAAGTDKFSMLVDPNTPITGGFSVDLSAGPQTLAAGVYSGQTRNFDLQFTVPSALTNSSSGVQQSIHVTIVISAP